MFFHIPITSTILIPDKNNANRNRISILGFGLANIFGSRYEIIRELGIGGFSCIYAARDSSDGKDSAVKIVAMGTHNNQEMKQIGREILIQKATLNHSNIVKYDECWLETFDQLPGNVRLDVSRNMSNSLIPIKYCVCMKMKIYDGSMTDWIEKRNNEFFNALEYVGALVTIRTDDKINRGFPNEQITKLLKYFDDILNAVSYYQNLKYRDGNGKDKEGIIHRDLKPRNILYDVERDTFLISDFGLARFYTETKSMTNIKATALYTAPEQWGITRYKKNVDYYALGIILFELLYPQSKDELKMNVEIIRDKHRLPDQMHVSLSELSLMITKMVNENADERPTLDDILETVQSCLYKLKSEHPRQ